MLIFVHRESIERQDAPEQAQTIRTFIDALSSHLSGEKGTVVIDSDEAAYSF